jgi:hypothetical protein
MAAVTTTTASKHSTDDPVQANITDLIDHALPHQMTLKFSPLRHPSRRRHRRQRPARRDRRFLAVSSCRCLQVRPIGSASLVEKSRFR